MRNLSPKEHDRLYGQAIVDFANAETSDDACYGSIENIQKIFNFSQDFPQKAKEGFSLVSLINITSSLNNTEKALFNLTFMRNYFEFDLCYYFEKAAFSLISYDFKDQNFILQKHSDSDDVTQVLMAQYVDLQGFRRKLGIDINPILNDCKRAKQSKEPVDIRSEIEKGKALIGELTDRYGSYAKLEKYTNDNGTLTIGIEQLSEFCENHKFSPRYNVFKDGKNDAYLKAKELTKVRSEIERLKQEISTDSYNFIRDLFDNERMKAHQELFYMQRKLIEVLAVIAQGKSLYKNKAINYFLGAYNENFMFSPDILPDGTLSFKAFNMAENSFTEIKEDNLYLYDKFINFCLIEFLKQPKNQKLIHICDECEEFFMSKTTRHSRFCSDKCRLAWHNRKRIESGEHRDYKRKKRKEGAKESYYG